MAERKSFLLRLDPVLYRALRRWADDDLRSVNGQIEFLLRHELRRAGRLRPRHGGPGAEGAGEMAGGDDAPAP